MRIVGADGCRAGWFYFELEGPQVRHGIASDLADLLAQCPDAERVFLDIPIGLLDSAPGVRACDREARRVLRPKRSSSVFPTPSRGACYAASYQEANALNRAAFGRGLSQQSWAIAGKICEVDALLRASSEARQRVREVHPEVCFWALAGAPMARSKKNPWGFLDRIEVLEHHFPEARRVIREAGDVLPSAAVAPDDICDALAVAVSARFESLATLPEEPRRDAHRLPMEMVYPLLPAADRPGNR